MPTGSSRRPGVASASTWTTSRTGADRRAYPRTDVGPAAPHPGRGHEAGAARPPAHTAEPPCPVAGTRSVPFQPGMGAPPMAAGPAVPADMCPVDNHHPPTERGGRPAASFGIVRNRTAGASKRPRSRTRLHPNGRPDTGGDSRTRPCATKPVRLGEAMNALRFPDTMRPRSARAGPRPDQDARAGLGTTGGCGGTPRGGAQNPRRMAVPAAGRRGIGSRNTQASDRDAGLREPHHATQSVVTDTNSHLVPVAPTARRLLCRRLIESRRVRRETCPP